MAFLGPALPWLASPLIAGISALTKKKAPTVAQPGPATRDDAAVMAARDAELARRRGAKADRISSNTEPVGGLGRLIAGS